MENLDSDALFTLGVILSDVGKDDESIDAYRRSLHLNAEDAELCYNLGVKLGDQKAMGKGDHTNGDVEMEMYARAVKIDPKFGGAWINWGTALAERGNIDDVSLVNILRINMVAHVTSYLFVPFLIRVRSDNINVRNVYLFFSNN